MPTYIPSSYGQSGQQPSYTLPQPPNYTAPQSPSQQLPNTPMPPVYPPQPSQQQKRSPVRAIVLAVIALVIILAGVSSFFIYHNNQIAQEHSNATATVQTSHNNATATALAQQNATATAVANTHLTATAIATSQYPPFTNVALNSPLASASSDWDSSSICQFTSTGYRVSIAQAGHFQYCLNSGTFGDSAYQVTMSIQQGNCGGLIFRRIDNNNLFLFEVCSDGTYDLSALVNSTWHSLYSANRASGAIQQGLNKQNVIAITVQGDTVNMYVNGNKIDTATNPALTSSTFSQGALGLMADDTGDPTAVTYTNALVWTAS